MIINENESKMLHILAVLLNVRNRFMKYGVVSKDEYARLGDAHVAPLVYDPISYDEDGGYTIYSGYGVTGRYHEDIYIRYFPNENAGLSEIEFAVPVTPAESCLGCHPHNGMGCQSCDSIEAYHALRLTLDGCITEKTEQVKPHDCGACCSCCNCEDDDELCREPLTDIHTSEEMEACRNAAEHTLCNCSCGEEHCFVECGPVNDEDCEYNENGRCHCPHNHCCGCNTPCFPDDE